MTCFLNDHLMLNNLIISIFFLNILIISISYSPHPQHVSATAAPHVLASPAPPPCELVQRRLGGLGPCEQLGFARRSCSRRRSWLLDQCRTWAVIWSVREGQRVQESNEETLCRDQSQSCPWRKSCKESLTSARSRDKPPPPRRHSWTQIQEILAPCGSDFLMLSV